MPNDPPPPPTGETGSSTTVQVERRCPVCDKPWVKTEPTLEQVRNAITEVFSSHKDTICKHDHQAHLGYCGSVASGIVGSGANIAPSNRKQHHGMEPDIRGECGTKYDIDGFIISTPLAKRVPEVEGKRWANRNKITREIQKAIDADLRSRSELAHMKSKSKDGFSILLFMQTRNNARQRPFDRIIF